MKYEGERGGERSENEMSAKGEDDDEETEGRGDARAPRV